MLRAWLDYHRATLAWKCEGLSDDQLREAAVPPSTLTLLGLVRHLAEVERWWFRVVFAREPDVEIFPSDGAGDGEWRHLDIANVAADFAAWGKECDAARAIEAAAASLDDTGRWASDSNPDQPLEPSLRWILTHMIEEYARHNGHVDLLRERIDGQTGD